MTDSTEDKKPTRAELLEEEGDIAADYLEELLDIVDLDGDIDIDVVDGRAQVAIVPPEDDSEVDILVGREGEVLNSLQELTRLAVQTATGQRSWLMLDIDGFRSRRRDQLKELANKKIDQVKETGESVALKPMNSFERKVIHDQVARAGLVSESEDEGPNRHVVISLS